MTGFGQIDKRSPPLIQACNIATGLFRKRPHPRQAYLKRVGKVKCLPQAVVRSLNFSSSKGSGNLKSETELDKVKEQPTRPGGNIDAEKCTANQDDSLQASATLEVQSLKDDLCDARTEIAKREVQIQKGRDNYQRLSQEIEDETSRVATLQTQLETRDRSLQAAREALVQADLWIEKAEAANECLNQENTVQQEKLQEWMRRAISAERRVRIGAVAQGPDLEERWGRFDLAGIEEKSGDEYGRHRSEAQEATIEDGEERRGRRTARVRGRQRNQRPEEMGVGFQRACEEDDDDGQAESGEEVFNAEYEERQYSNTNRAKDARLAERRQQSIEDRICGDQVRSSFSETNWQVDAIPRNNDRALTSDTGCETVGDEIIGDENARAASADNDGNDDDDDDDEDKDNHENDNENINDHDGVCYRSRVNATDDSSISTFDVKTSQDVNFVGVERRPKDRHADDDDENNEKRCFSTADNFKPQTSYPAAAQDNAFIVGGDGSGQTAVDKFLEKWNTTDKNHEDGITAGKHISRVNIVNGGKPSPSSFSSLSPVRRRRATGEKICTIS